MMMMMRKLLKSQETIKMINLIMREIRNLVDLFSRKIKSRMKVNSKNQITRRNL